MFTASQRCSSPSATEVTTLILMPHLSHLFTLFERSANVIELPKHLRMSFPSLCVGAVAKHSRWGFSQISSKRGHLRTTDGSRGERDEAVVSPPRVRLWSSRKGTASRYPVSIFLDLLSHDTLTCVCVPPPDKSAPGALFRRSGGVTC